MGLKPEASLTVGLATGAIVLAIYNRGIPSAADIRVSGQDDPDLASARKMAAWTSAGVVAGISLIARDPTIFIVGGAMTIAVDWWTRTANANDPMAGRVTLTGQGENTALQDIDPDPVFMSGVG